jgi:hypothetical protein
MQIEVYDQFLWSIDLVKVEPSFARTLIESAHVSSEIGELENSLVIVRS